MAKKLNKRQRDKIKDEMWQMLIGINQGQDVDTMNNDDGQDIPYTIGIEPWLKWCAAIRRRYANKPVSEWAFLPHAIDDFMEFDKAHKRICELVDNEAAQETV
jgi:hypothetical protein